MQSEFLLGYRGHERPKSYPPPYFSETIFNIIFSILVFSFEIF